MFVSRKYLALIHFVAREMPARLHVSKPAHQGIERRATARPGGVFLKPLPKGGIQSLALGLSHQARSFDEGFFGTESYVFHTDAVYTISVHTTSVASTRFTA